MYNEFARMPFNPHNIHVQINAMFGEDPEATQTQTQAEPSADTQRRMDMTALLNHVSKPLNQMTSKERA